MEVTPSTPCWEGPSQTRHAQPHRGPWETRQSPPQPLNYHPPPSASLRHEIQTHQIYTLPVGPGRTHCSAQLSPLTPAAAHSVLCH